MGQLAWEMEQKRLREEAEKARLEEAERFRKLKWAVGKMNARLLSACFCGLAEYNRQMKGVKKMLVRVLQGVKLRLCTW